jgi:mannose-1-phosphate guanylyltransferase/mannose-6-phosphate isomerase
VILGIKPTRPETGYGHIKRGEVIGSEGEFDVERFEEKPDLEVAKDYIASGCYSWNSGMFIIRASVWIKALGLFRSDILNSTRLAFELSSIDHQFIRPDADMFRKVPNDSIDYSVIEKCPGSEFSIKVIPLDAGWNDLGAWDAVWEAGDKDHNGNIIKGDVIIESSKNNLIYASHRLVSAVGVNDLVIIETADAVMVANRNQSQNVKKIVSQLSNKSREEHELHRKVSRPWGWYDTIDFGENFKVKRIQVKPGASLSLQKHERRAEHWVVIKGVAEITNGDKVSILSENQSSYISIGQIHRLNNPGDTVLEIIEVQSGSYLGEDDILRLKDTYGRCD